MTAEEMFKELGFSKTSENEFIIVFDNEDTSEYGATYKSISFDLIYSCVDCKIHDDMGERSGSLYADEIKVIQKQIEELGW